MRRLIFEIQGADTDAAVGALSSALGVEMRQRESSYWGGVYFRSGKPGEEEVYFFSNEDLDGGREQKRYEDADSSSWIVRIDKTDRDADDLVKRLSDLGLSVRRLKADPP